MKPELSKHEIDAILTRFDAKAVRLRRRWFRTFVQVFAEGRTWTIGELDAVRASVAEVVQRREEPF